MEAANTEVEQVVWALSLILTTKRKAHSILPTNKQKKCIKTKDGHGTRVAQNKKDIHIYLKAARNQSLARSETRKFFVSRFKGIMGICFHWRNVRSSFRDTLTGEQMNQKQNLRKYNFSI